MPVMLRRARRREGLAQQRCWQVEQAVHRHRCSVTTRAEVSPTCLLASVLQAASPSAREPWKPRPGDGISSNWLIAELTHRQALASSSVLT